MSGINNNRLGDPFFDGIAARLEHVSRARRGWDSAGSLPNVNDLLNSWRYLGDAFQKLESIQNRLVHLVDTARMAQGSARQPSRAELVAPKGHTALATINAVHKGATELINGHRSFRTTQASPAKTCYYRMRDLGQELKSFVRLRSATHRLEISRILQTIAEGRIVSFTGTFMLGGGDQCRIQRWATAVVILAEVEQALVLKKPDDSLEALGVLHWKTTLYERAMDRTENDAAQTEADRIVGLREDNLYRFDRVLDSNVNKPKDGAWLSRIDDFKTAIRTMNRTQVEALNTSLRASRPKNGFSTNEIVAIMTAFEDPDV